MLRLVPDAELALPPIQPVEISSSREAVGCWTVRERRPPVQPRGKTGVSKGRRAVSSDPRVNPATDDAGASLASAGGIGSKRAIASLPVEMRSARTLRLLVRSLHLVSVSQRASNRHRVRSTKARR